MDSTNTGQIKNIQKAVIIMLQKIKAGFLALMRGRYGMDTLNFIILWLGAGFAFINILVKSNILYLIQTILLMLLFLRLMSRNYIKRRAENAFFNKIINKIKSFFTLRKDMLRDRNTHVYKKCPDCKATLRLPKTKGEHTARCPRCSKRFDVKI